MAATAATRTSQQSLTGPCLAAPVSLRHIGQGPGNALSWGQPGIGRGSTGAGTGNLAKSSQHPAAQDGASSTRGQLQPPGEKTALAPCHRLKLVALVGQQSAGTNLPCLAVSIAGMASTLQLSCHSCWATFMCAACPTAYSCKHCKRVGGVSRDWATLLL